MALTCHTSALPLWHTLVSPPPTADQQGVQDRVQDAEDHQAEHRPPRTGHSRRAALRSALGLVISGAGLSALAGGRAARAQTSLHAPAVLRLPDIEAAAQITDVPGALSAELFVAGGPGTAPARWAPLLATAFSDTLPTDAPMDMRTSAGQDGVTGANLFDAQSIEDTTAALLVPGAAIMASQTGDSRVHFDYQRWLPVLLGTASPVVVGRVDFRRSLRTLLQDHPVRVAVSVPTGIELPTILAMTLLSMRPIPVSGLAAPADAMDALRKGEVDVIQLPASNAKPDVLATLARDGFEPLFTLDAQDGGPAPDFATRFAALRGHAPRNPLYPAYCAVAATAAMDTGLVLPMLTPPALAARWRHAASLVASRPEIVALARDAGVHLVAGIDSAEAYGRLRPELSNLLALRRWVAERGADWRTG